MGRKSRIDGSAVEKARQYCGKAKTAEELRMALAVILPERFKITLGETAEIIGVSAPTVSRLRKRMESVGEATGPPRANWGGRRRGNLTEAEEREFLRKWERTAGKSPMRSLTPVHRDYVKHFGTAVPKSTVHRLFKRNGWTKGRWFDGSKAWTFGDSSTWRDKRKI